MRNIVKFLTEFFLLAFLGMPITAQTSMVDHWFSAEQTFAATSSPCYYPSIKRRQKLAENEVIRGLPSMSAVDMDLPDRMGGRGWVKIEAGRPFVYDRTNGQVLRLEECNNHVYSVVPFPPIQGLQGPPGPQGPMGPRGYDGRDADFARREAIRDNLPKGNWYTHSWRDHPFLTGLVHAALVYAVVPKHHGGDNNPKGKGDTIP